MSSLKVVFDHGTGGNTNVVEFSYVASNNSNNISRSNVQCTVFPNIGSSPNLSEGSSIDGTEYKSGTFLNGTVLVFYPPNDASHPFAQLRFSGTNVEVLSPTGTVLDPFEYRFVLVDVDETQVGKWVSGTLYDSATYQTEFGSGGSEGGEGDDPGTIPAKTYQIRVDDSVVASNAFTTIYDQRSHVLALYEDGVKMTSFLMWYIDGSHITAPNGTLVFTDVCSFGNVEVRGYDSNPISFAITKKEITASVDSSVSFNKYYDGSTIAPIPPNVFSYSGWCGTDGNNISVYPSAQYASVGNKSQDSANIGITFEFTLEGVRAENYTVIPPTGKTGTIYKMSDADKPSANGFALKVTKGEFGGSSSVDIPINSSNSDENPLNVPYDPASYYITVVNGTQVVDENSYESDWLYTVVINGHSPTRPINDATSISFSDAHLYRGRVYVKGTQSNSLYRQGYAYVGEVWLNIQPVINVSWIAASYEG